MGKITGDTKCGIKEVAYELKEITGFEKIQDNSISSKNTRGIGHFSGVLGDYTRSCQA